MILNINLNSLTPYELNALSSFLPRFFIPNSKRIYEKNVIHYISHPFLDPLSGNMIEGFRITKFLCQYVLNSNANEYGYAISDERIGSGEFGVVYASYSQLKFGENNLLMQQFKEKIIKHVYLYYAENSQHVDPELEEDVIREADLLLNSLHKGKKLIFANDNKSVYLISERFFDCSMSDLLREHQALGDDESPKTNYLDDDPLTLEELFLLCLRMVQSLKLEIHNRSIVHGDYGKSNLIVSIIKGEFSRDFVVKPIDLGRSRKFDAENQPAYDGKYVKEIIQSIFKNHSIVDMDAMDEEDEEYQIISNLLKCSADADVMLSEVEKKLEESYFSLVNLKNNKFIRQENLLAKECATLVKEAIQHCYLYNKNTCVDEYIQDIHWQHQIICQQAKLATGRFSTFIFYSDIQILKNCRHYAELETALSHAVNFIVTQCENFKRLMEIFPAPNLQDYLQMNMEHVVEANNAVNLMQSYHHKLLMRNSSLDEMMMFSQKLNKLFQTIKCFDSKLQALYSISWLPSFNDQASYHEAFKKSYLMNNLFAQAHDGMAHQHVLDLVPRI